MNPLDQQESSALVEHFFRHEYANLVSVLTRCFGFARIDLVEDMVSAAMHQAMQTWKQSGVPQNPAAWIHRVARNAIVDSLRREKTHEKALAFSGLWEKTSRGVPAAEELLNDWLDESVLPDSLLRMMFVCCHPSLERRSQIALTLKILCGFSIKEIASGLLMPADTAKKRVQRAKQALNREPIDLELPSGKELQQRLAVVHEVLYLMFNEGYSTSHGVSPIRDDVCEEAARLCHLLCEHSATGNQESKAILALMLFHAARLPARVDSIGNPVLLEEQDRSQWDRRLIGVADAWLVRSAQPSPSRYHFEAAIAQIHCAAESLEATNWPAIIMLYERLFELFPSPIYRLNQAIARGQSGDVTTALQQVQSLRENRLLNDYCLLECAAGYLHQLAGDKNAAARAYRAALNAGIAEHQRTLVERKIQALQT